MILIAFIKLMSHRAYAVFKEITVKNRKEKGMLPSKSHNSCFSTLSKIVSLIAKGPL
jgi:hypothetical protein